MISPALHQPEFEIQKFGGSLENPGSLEEEGVFIQYVQNLLVGHQKVSGEDVSFEFLSFRIISDSPGSEDQMQQYSDFWGTIAENSFQNIYRFLNALPEAL